MENPGRRGGVVRKVRSGCGSAICGVAPFSLGGLRTSHNVPTLSILVAFRTAEDASCFSLVLVVQRWVGSGPIRRIADRPQLDCCSEVLPKIEVKRGCAAYGRPVVESSARLRRTTFQPTMLLLLLLVALLLLMINRKTVASGSENQKSGVGI